MTESTGRTEEAFKQNMQTLDAQWKIIKNNMTSLGKTMLGWLIPVLTKTLSTFNKLFDGINNGFQKASKASRWFTGLFTKDTKKQTQALKQETTEQTQVKKDAELEQLANYQESKAKEVDILIATLDEQEKLRKEALKKERDLQKEEQAAFDNMMDLRNKALQEQAEKQKRIVEERQDTFIQIVKDSAKDEKDIIKGSINGFKGIIKQQLEMRVRGLQAEVAAFAAANWWNPFALAGAAAAGVGLEAVLSEGKAAIDRFEDGGFIGGSARIGDTRIIRGNSGEAILNTSQQHEFMKIANGGMSGNSDTSKQLSRIENALMQPQTIRLNGDSFTKAVITREKRLIRTGQISTKG